jgi:hypothetical protein
MARYKNPRFMEDEAEIDKMTEEFKAEVQIENEKPADKEEETFKKRYSDLRRHSQQEKAALEKRLSDLERQLNDSANKQMQFPKTEEELETWRNRYPDVAAIMDTMIKKQVQEGVEKSNERFSELDQLKRDLTAKEAYMKLLEKHPDFNELKRDEKFLEWIEDSRVSDDGSQWAYEALFENDTDWKLAAKAVSFYKATVGTSKTKDTPDKSKSKYAASGVKTNSGRNEPSDSDQDFTESQIQKMSANEYEKNEAAIRKALQNGRVLMDISGGAR